MLIKKNKIPFKQIALLGVLPSFIKKAIYRLQGHTIGKGVVLGFGSVIVGKRVTIMDGARLGMVVVVRGEEIFLGKRVNIGSFTFIDSGKVIIKEDAKINEQVIVGGMKRPDSALYLGKRTVIMEYSFINTTCPVTIGDDSGVGGHCLLFTHGSWLNELEGFPVTFAPITIGSSVWLPWRVFIMPGVTIGDKVVVGAASLINKSVPANSLVAGSPAKIIKSDYPVPLDSDTKMEIFRKDVREFSEFLKYHGFATAMHETAIALRLEISDNKEVSELICYFDANIALPLQVETDTVIAININNSSMALPVTAPSRAMILDIGSKRRIGRSRVGEEFAKFLSRYGLRFERLD